MANINERVLASICNDCDEIDGWGFTRTDTLIDLLIEDVDNGQAIKDLMDQNIIEVDGFDNCVWVKPEWFEKYYEI